MHENQKRVNILEILVSYAPSDVDIHYMQNVMANDSLQDLVGYLYDGLTFGNWPWTSYMMAGNRFKRKS